MIWEMENVFSEFSAKQWLLLAKEGHCTIYAFICQKHKVKWLNWRFCREVSINIICPCLYSQWDITGNSVDPVGLHLFETFYLIESS